MSPLLTIVLWFPGEKVLLRGITLKVKRPGKKSSAAGFFFQDLKGNDQDLNRESSNRDQIDFRVGVRCGYGNYI
jgi:hypothetical protein